MTTEELKSLVIDLYPKKAGIVAEVCRAANISRQTFYRWRKEDPVFDEAIKEARESLLDFVEAKLMQTINDGNLTAIIFFLKCQAKKRGYVERQEWSGPGGGPVPVKMYDFNPAGFPLPLLTGKPVENGEDKGGTKGTEEAEKKTEGAEKGPDGGTPGSEQVIAEEKESEAAIPGPGTGGDGVQSGAPEEVVAESAKEGGGDQGGPDQPQQ